MGFGGREGYFLKSGGERYELCSRIHQPRMFPEIYIWRGGISEPVREKKEFVMENQERSGGATGGGRSLRGFASMDREKQRAIASKGGRAAHEKGTAHEFNSDEASMAAKKGHERGTAHEFTPEEARVAGRKGGLARAMNRTNQGAGSSDGEAISSGGPSGHHNPAEGMSAAGAQSTGPVTAE